MPQKRVLYFDNTHLAAYQVRNGAVLHEGDFVADESGLAAFGDYLRQHRRSLFMVLADVTEESFQTEDIPYSTGKDRRAILRRKLAQNFYGTPYTLGQSQGRLKSGRRDERMLLMALTQPQLLAPWVDALLHNKVFFTGIYSIAQIIADTLPPAGAGQSLLLLLTSAGLRQTYFTDGQIRFSRLTPLVHSDAESSAIAAATEAAKMHQYLTSQRLIEREKPLITRVLTDPGALAEMRRHCLDTANLRFEFADLLEAARRVGLRTLPGSSRADMLLCYLLARKSPAEQFAPPDQLGCYRLWQASFALKITGILVIASAMLFASHKGVEILQLRDAVELAQQEIRLNQDQYTLRMQALPKVPIGAEDLRALIARYAQVEQRSRGPTPLLAQISRSLDAFPPINIDRIEWAIAEQIPPASPASNAAQAVPAQMTSGPYAMATVSARLPGTMIGDQRGQLAMVADFARHLGTEADSFVTVLQQPVDTQSGKTLKSGDERSTPEAPRFVFRVARKL